jgi:hypothetical protein
MRKSENKEEGKDKAGKRRKKETEEKSRDISEIWATMIG